jgi:serine/threonine protein kinase
VTGGDVARGTSNRYELLARLAEGGMAEIFLARAGGIAGFERYVVLKRIHPERGDDPQWVSMFLDEARLAAQLTHPNIAQVFDIGELDDSYFYTMEYVHGEDALAVQSRLAALNTPMPIGVALAIAHGALQGLAYAHDRCSLDGKPLGIVHRDVSPSNVMVTYEGVVKVLDFGVAKARTRSNETQVGTIMGKVAYLSPEQCRARPLDRRSDIFSLGIMLYELLTQHRPFKRNTDHETIHAIVKFAPPPPIEVNPSLPPALDALVMRMLAKDPAERFESAAALIDAIEALADDLKLSLAPRELKRFMRELFGMRPEPWREMLVSTEALKTFEGSIIGPMGPLTEILTFPPDAEASAVPLLPQRSAPAGTPGIPVPEDNLPSYRPIPRLPTDDLEVAAPTPAYIAPVAPLLPPVRGSLQIPAVTGEEKSGSVIVPPRLAIPAAPRPRNSGPVIALSATIAICIAVVVYVAWDRFGASSSASAVEPAAGPPPTRPIATPIVEDTKPRAPDVKPIEEPAKQPEVKQPEVKQPVVKAPETKQPETKQPAVKQPETKQPVGKQPEVKPPVVKQPEVKPPVADKPKIRQPVKPPKPKGKPCDDPLDCQH